MYVYISSLYMFRASQCSSSGDEITKYVKKCVKLVISKNLSHVVFLSLQVLVLFEMSLHRQVVKIGVFWHTSRADRHLNSLTFLKT